MTSPRPALSDDPTNNLVYIRTQGTLAANDSANELHPTPAGFKKIADKCLTALAAQFRGGI